MPNPKVNEKLSRLNKTFKKFAWLISVDVESNLEARKKDSFLRE